MQLTLEKKTNLLLGLYIGALIAANLIGLKIADFTIFEASVGILVLPVLFLVTDIIEEVHGREKTKEFVYIGLVVLVFILIVTFLAVILPTASRSILSQQEYEKVFGTTLRIFIASIVGFIISQMHDVWAFNFWKKKTNNKHLWLRNNASTIISTFIDTTIFYFIAFYGVMATDYLINLIIPYWLIKVLFAFFDTPFCYLGVRWLKKDSSTP